MNAKPWWASKTIWANVVMLIVTVLGVTKVADIDPELQATVVAVVMGIVNLILRIVTKGPVTP